MQSSTAINPTKRYLYLLVGPSSLFVSFLAFFVLLPRETPYWLFSLIVSLGIGLFVTKLASDEAADLLPEPEVVEVEIEKIRIEEKIHIEERIPDQIQQELHTYKEEREQSAKQITLLKRSESKAQEKLAEIQNESRSLNDRFEREKNSLNKTIEELNTKIGQTQQQGQQELERVKSELKRIPELEEKLRLKMEEKIEPDAEARRWEGLYKQLRQQFDEKSNVLNETRRELFISQEKIEKLSREKEEYSLNSQTPLEKELELQIVRLEQEYDQAVAHYESEIAALEEIIQKAT